MISALGFKARVDSLACFLACALFLRFTSGATPADLLTRYDLACGRVYSSMSTEGCCAFEYLSRSEAGWQCSALYREHPQWATQAY